MAASSRRVNGAGVRPSRFLDRHRRTAFGTVTELRRHEAIAAGGETGRWRVRYAGLRLIKAGPTGGATMQQVELSVSFVLRATWSDIRDSLPHEIAHAIIGPGHGHAVWQTPRRIGCTAKPCSTVTHSPKVGADLPRLLRTSH